MEKQTYAQLVKRAKKFNKDKSVKDQIVISRTNLGFCKNEGCDNKRRTKSSFCQECSDKHK